MQKSPKHLVVQYYTVKSEDHTYRSKRQEEVNQCLLLNLQNRYLDVIHLLTEEWFDLDFIPTELKHKLNQIVIHKRLDYTTAFEYYNAHIPNTICILANADIFTDESIEVLDHIVFDRSVLALNRYEYDSDERAALLSGLEINRNFPLLFPNYGPTIWSQDAWVWKASSIYVPNVDFVLGSWGCDIRIAYLLRQANYIVYNPSYLVSISHYDRMSAIVNEHGVLKGQISETRDPPPADYNEKRLFLMNEDDIIDIYTMVSDIVEEKRLGQAVTHLSLKKTVQELTYTSSASSSHNTNLPQHAIFKTTGFWQYSNDDTEKYIECDFGKLCTIHILDTTGKLCSRSDHAIGHISKMCLAYFANGQWNDYPHVLNGQTHSIANFIKRNYLEPVQCSKCRIYCVEATGIPALKIRFYGVEATR